MSETGATVPSRDDLVMGAFEECSGPYVGISPDEILKLTTYTEAVVDYLLFVLRRKIVPAGAVVLTADEAVTASYACAIAADAAYEPVEQDEYRALAAKLGGAS